VLVYRTPLQFTPPILNLHTVILDSHAVLTALEIGPDGAMTADERQRVAGDINKKLNIKSYFVLYFVLYEYVSHAV
jgi:hypothetical protein